jgi:tetratricopeptide (TPR) repeat protein
MINYNETLAKLKNNLNILQEREAKYADNAPLDLLNQIKDHQKAIILTEQAIAGDISKSKWRKAMKPLLIAIQSRNGEAAVSNISQTARGNYIAQATHGGTATVNINQASEEPPFWRRLSRANLILAIVLGLMATAAAVLAVPQFNALVFTEPLPTPTQFPLTPSANDETLIVIATFHETAANKSEPHTKIRRAIQKAADEVGLETVRVEEEPTILKADERKEAEVLGSRYQAAMVIWGEDTGVEIIVNFLNLKQTDVPATEVKIEERERVQLTNPDGYARFIVEDLPSQLTFLSLFAIGQSFFIEGKFAQALTTIEQAIASLTREARPEGLAEAYYWVGWLHHVLFADTKQAIENYTRAITLKSNYSDAYYNRGNAYADRGDYERAISDFTQVITIDPDDATAYNNRGTVYSDRGDLELAIADLTRAIDLNPNYATAYNNRGAVYADQGDLTTAITNYNKAIAFNPNSASAYYNRGNAYYAQGDLKLALTDFTQAISIKPYFGAYTNRGIIHYDQGNLEQAISDYNEAIDLNPNYAIAYNNRGNAYSKKGDLKQAITDYDKTIDLNPNYANAYYNRGNAFKSQGDLNAAIADYNKAIQLNPKDTSAYYHRALAHSAQGDLEAAIRDFKHGLSLDLDPASRKEIEKILEELKSRTSAPAINPTPSDQ